MTELKKVSKKSKNLTKKTILGGQTKWKKVKLAGNLLSDEGGAGLEGLLGLEVLENYDCKITKQKIPKVPRRKVVEKNSDAEEFSDNENSESSRKKKKKKKKKSKNASKESAPGKFVLLKPRTENEDKTKPAKKQKKNGKSQDEGQLDCVDEEMLTVEDMGAWNGLGVPEVVLKALAEKKFLEPTEIQTLTLPAAILGRRDILGAAETGSGKTLAFGIPIINGILELRKSGGKKPFRKLTKKTEALDQNSNQAENELKSKKKKSNKRRGERDNWTPPPEEVNNFPNFGRDIVEEDGGEPDDENASKPLYALILTPTRELCVQVKDHIIAAAKYTDIRIAAVFGGLAVVKQERILSKCPEIVVATPGRLWELINEGNKHLNKIDNINFLVVDETDRMIEKGHFEELQHILERLNVDQNKREQRQNFVFSATLTLIHDLPQYLKVKNMNRKHKLKAQTSEDKLKTVIEHFGISQPKIIDITPSQTTGGTAKKITECRITCEHEQKDLYLYYFLQRHPGRTIVFCNSIECVRRLHKLFAILNCEPYPLHAKMAQRQRLKNLERFSSNPTGLLIATDVAARGLDIPNVEHVIHYQVPRTSENYIHRSGRTARGNKEGIAVLFMEPNELNDYVKLCRALKRNEDLPFFPITDRYLSAVRERVNLAKQIDLAELKLRRKNTDIGWLKKCAKEMDILVDDQSDFSEGDLYDSDDGGGAIERSIEKRDLRQKQDALNRLLTKTIFPKGISFKYPGSNSDSTLIENAMSNGTTNTNREKAVDVMKSAIAENKIAKKNRNKKIRPL